MINAMRTLALDYLRQEYLRERQKQLGQNPLDSEDWYQTIRRNEPEAIFPYLTEDHGRIEKVYILTTENSSEDTLLLSVEDLGSDNPGRLPFLKPTGSQSPAIGPVIKRSYDKNKGSGPSKKIIKSTVKYFKEVAVSEKPWDKYFADIVDILNRPKVKLPSGDIVDWREAGYTDLLACVVDRIGPQKDTVFVAIRDSKGQLPGDNALYSEYLLKEKLAGERYTTGKIPAREKSMCCLCGLKETTIYANGLKGAGINLINADRVGVFPGVKEEYAWKAFAICAPCADLLYIYKNHVIKRGGSKKEKRPFTTKIAGSASLLIPHFLPGLPVVERFEVLGEVQSYIHNMSADVSDDEDSLLDILKEKKSILNFDIVWVDIGQNIENVRGIITSVLPSRLRELSEINLDSKNWHHPLFPKEDLADEPSSFKPNLSLNALRSFFHRPGGKKAKEINKSKQLFELKRHIAESVYHEKILLEKRFWSEWLTTARWYFAEAIEKEKGYKNLLYEGKSKKGSYLTTAGWIKHVNWWLNYFKEVGVMEREKDFFEPGMEELKPYFGAESSINEDEKAFAFLLGVLYGKLLSVQGAKGINVGANALTWLKRLTLQGRDLPELYTKIRAKLLAYGTESSSSVRKLLIELSQLGIKLGDEIGLDETKTNYYLLLGQAMATEILPVPAKEREE